MDSTDIIVIGGGAAGLMAAGRAAERGARVVLLEKMGQTGRKIGISGKGRCNLTNSAELSDFLEQFGRNGRFLRQSFQQFFSHDLITFFTDLGLPVTCERGGRIFPQSGRALDVVKVLNSWLEEKSVSIKRSSPVNSLLIENNAIKGVIYGGKKLYSNNVILATGGKSYPRTGSTGDGYSLAAQGGHTIVDLRPALVPLRSKNIDFKGLNGLDLKNIQVRLFIDSKRKGQKFGELSFTHYGLTGPTILTLSGQIVDALKHNQKVSIGIDLKPALDDKKLHARLLRDFEKRGTEPIASVLRGLLPQKMVDYCMQACNIPSDQSVRDFPVKMRRQLVQWFKDFRVDIAGHRSWDEAIITAGGVSLKEINPKTMESKLVKGLHIAGELLDLNGNTGGYNLQAAFSTGFVAGSSVHF